MRSDDEPRPDWDHVWMKVADAVADRSLCSRAKVGTVVVTSDNRVASVSFNGAPDAFDCQGRPCVEWCERAMSGDTSPSYGTCSAVHAESNALTRSNWTEIQGGTIYTSAATCINCARLVVAAGLKRVVHRVSPSDMHRNPEAVEQYMRELGLDVDRADAEDR